MTEDRSRSRREFLMAGAAGIAGAAFMANASCSPSPQGKSTKPGSFVYRTLGRTGLRLPVVSMGSAYAIDLVRTALDEGMGYIHTSSSYSERNQERMLGRAMRGLSRESFVIGTSPDLPYILAPGDDRSLDVGRNVNPDLIIQSLEGSLQRLGLEYVDIYYLASVSSRESTLFEPYVKAFASLKATGKARFVGITTHSNEPEVIRAATESGFWDVVLTAYNFRQSHREEIRAAIAQAAAAGLGVVAMKTQAGVYWDPGRRTKINMKAALKWVLADENVHTAVPAFSNYDELREDLSVMENLALTPEEIRDLRLGDSAGLAGLFCQQCRRCLPQCPAGMNIPALMRSAMYALGYRQAQQARQVLHGYDAADIACGRCRRCSVQCTLGLDVRSRALEVAQILAPHSRHYGA